MKGRILIVFAFVSLCLWATGVFAQASDSVVYVPLIGLTSVPDSFALPDGGGNVTYKYAVKNFIREAPLSGVRVTDNTCASITFVTGDDNNNSLLDYDETWRYVCATRISVTTESIATVTGSADGMTATHKAYATVLVGSSDVPPLVSIINITKVAYPLSLPAEGGKITFAYRVNNPGMVPLSNVSVVDDKCSAMSSRLGDTNGNNLLDIQEVWSYTCTTILKETTTNTVKVTAFANGRKAVDETTLTVKVALSGSTFGWKFPIAKFPLTGSTAGQIAYSDIRDPGGIPQGLPVRLKIPSIRVDSAIEDALITPDGRMDVPAGSLNVAWFALGPHPGQKGSAVIGGHFGIENGVPFVFYDLNKLKIGDKIYIEDDTGATLAFIVRKIQSFDRDGDATSVFTSSDGIAHLNLITCEGLWNKVNDTYPQRLVVFTDATSVDDSAPSPTPFLRLLDMGAQGSDVIALQAALEDKGFLTMPLGVSKGFFGLLTSTALGKYQTSIGLPAAGVLGPLTRARLNLEAQVPLSLPDAGDVLASSAGISIKDGLISLFIIGSIIFVIFKIIRL